MRTLLRLIPAVLVLCLPLAVSAAAACTKEACGPAMGMPNWQCPDGSVGGPVCGRDGEGVCGWRVHDCPNDSGFSDVPTSHPNSDAIFYMKSHGMVEGYSDGTYRPDATINRAEFTKILVAAFFPATDCSLRLNQFPDVANGQWFAVYVCVAASEEWIQGYPDGTFAAANTLNFAEVAKILAKSFKLEAMMTIPACDGDCPWYRPYVLMLEMKGAIPTSITRFDQNITRGEMAEMIYRLRMGGDKPSRTYEELAGGSEGNVEYVLRYNNEFKTGLPIEEEYDGVIVEKNLRTGEETILVSSIKDALPELKKEWNTTLELFASPKGSNAVIFKSVLKETDNSSGVLYSFNTTTHQFAKMRISDEYDGFYDGSTLSPDERHIVWSIGIDTEGENKGFMPNLVVASLVDDSTHVAVLLDWKKGETLNGGGFALESSFDITWTDDHTVRYAVYDQSMKDAGASASEAFVGYRTVSID